MSGYIINFYKTATTQADQKPYLMESIEKSTCSANTPNAALPSTTLLDQRFLAFGDIDRVGISQVHDFGRYRNIDSYAQQWLGPRQSVLLYQLEPNEPNNSDLLGIFFEKQGTDGKSRGIDSVPDGRFLIFTMIMLNPVLHESKDFADTLKQCRRSILKYIHSVCNDRDIFPLPPSIECEVYGSFSSSELMLVWSSEQYIDVMQIVDSLRDTCFATKTKSESNHDIPEKTFPFISFYSLITQLRRPKASADEHSCATSPDVANYSPPYIKGTAEIRFIYQDGVTSSKERQAYLQKVLDTMQKHQNVSCSDIPQISITQNVGEYDWSIRLPADLICNQAAKMFDTGGFLHFKNECFKMHVARTQTQLYYPSIDAKCLLQLNELSVDAASCIRLLEQKAEVTPKTDIKTLIDGIKRKIYSAPDSAVSNKISDTEKDVLTLYQNLGLRAVLKDRFPETVGFCDTLDLLYSDYVNNCTNLTSIVWSRNLTEQFHAVLDYIASQLSLHFDCDEQPFHFILSDDFYNSIAWIVNDFKQIIYHVSQSRRSLVIVPSCHLRYLAQYDMILHAYYGLEKFLLNIASLQESTGNQPKLVPMFTVDVVPEIRTRMYRISRKVPDNAEKGSDENSDAIFSINMPLTAMVDFLRYSIVIAHETAHYVIPKDRNKRNQIIGMLFFSEYIANCMVTNFPLLCSDQSFGEGKWSADLYERAVIVLMHFIYDNYRKYFIKEIHTPILTSPGVDEACNFSWAKYKFFLFEKLSSLYTNRCIDAAGTIYSALNRDVDKISALLEKMFCDLYKFAAKKADITSLLDPSLDQFVSEITSTIRVPNASRGFFEDFENIGDCFENSSMLSDGYREACQDLPMICLFKLTLVDYLVFRDRHKNDILVLDKAMPNAEKMRIAMICDYLITAGYQRSHGGLVPSPQTVYYSLLSLKKEYIELFRCVPEMQHKADAPSRLNDSFQCIVAAVCEYFECFLRFRNLFLMLLLDSDLDAKPELGDTLQANPLPSYYAAWKDAILLTPETQECHARDAIFNNNIAMIQHFQNHEGCPDKDSFGHTGDSYAHIR